ncbi:MAG: serine hydrolase [Patescibacteria group bacterium]|nr:MAG: serine hydrolase [Patescibacteria group bacterium]
MFPIVPLLISVSVLGSVYISQSESFRSLDSLSFKVDNNLYLNNYLVMPQDKSPEFIGGETLVLQASSAIVTNELTLHPLFSWEANSVRPIASLTKLMTALTVLDNYDINWDKKITIIEADRREGSKQNIFVGDELSLRDLFIIGLMASDNDAIIALIRGLGVSEEDFVLAMNQRAKHYRLFSASFSEPTGLSSANQSSAFDVAKLASLAFKRAEIKEALSLTAYEITDSKGSVKRLISTNVLLREGSKEGLIVGKTGHISLAGYCFAGLYSKNGNDIITVVLGAHTQLSRFSESEELAHWVYSSYNW